MSWSGNRRVIAGLIVVAGAICLTVAIGWSIYKYRWLSVAVRTQGQVVELVRHQDGGDSFSSVFTFRDSGGATHKVYESGGSYPPRRRVGNRVGVLYSPTAPDDAIIDDWLATWSLPLAIGVNGVVSLALGLVMWHWPRIAGRWQKAKGERDTLRCMGKQSPTLDDVPLLSWPPRRPHFLIAGGIMLGVVLFAGVADFLIVYYWSRHPMSAEHIEVTLAVFMGSPLLGGIVGGLLAYRVVCRSKRLQRQS